MLRYVYIIFANTCFVLCKEFNFRKRQCYILHKGKYVACLFVSLLSHFRLSDFSHTTVFANHMKALLSYMNSIRPQTAKVCSSYSHMRGPGICCWFSDRFIFSHWSFKFAGLPINPNSLTTANLSLYITLLLYWSLCNYAAHAADILAPSSAEQSVGNHSLRLHCRHC